MWEDSGGEAVVGLLDAHSQSQLCIIPSHPPWHLPARVAAVITPPATRYAPFATLHYTYIPPAPCPLPTPPLPCRGPWSKVPPRRHLLLLDPAMRLTFYVSHCRP